MRPTQSDSEMIEKFLREESSLFKQRVRAEGPDKVRWERMLAEGKIPGYKVGQQ